MILFIKHAAVSKMNVIYQYNEELLNQYFDTFCKKYKLKINIKNNKKKNYFKIIKFYI